MNDTSAPRRLRFTIACLAIVAITACADDNPPADLTDTAADVGLDSSGDSGADDMGADDTGDPVDDVAPQPDGDDARPDGITEPDSADGDGGDGDTADDGTDDGVAPVPPGPRPETPRIIRDLHRFDGEELTQPLLPPNRTTMDGRVSLIVQGGASVLQFQLFVPERVSEPLLDGPPGRRVLATTDPVVVPLLPDEHDYTGHHAICDPTEEFAREGERPNPYACGEDDASDCYDFVVVTNTVHSTGAQIWGVPAHVVVANPKTVDAHITEVTLGEPVRGAFLSGSDEWTEPAVTMDGRLLTGRRGDLPSQWTHPQTGEVFNARYDIMYSVLTDEFEPCDVTGWDTFHPISHAPFDPDMIGRYGIADYPFRDSEGNPIPDGADIGGTYPWVDRHGRNLFMSAVPDVLARTPDDAYPRRCVEAGCGRAREADGWQKGYLVAGGWTHGRLVHLDGMFNHTDWPIPVDPAHHVYVTLYDDPSTGEPVEVRVGSGRVSRDDRVVPHGLGGNVNIFDSIENLFNHQPEFRPGTPRDIVWTLTTGAGTDELAFDDYLHPDAFIVSNMQGSVTIGHPNTIYPSRYWNGLVDRYLFWAFESDVHIQNAATTLPDRWVVPAYGRVPFGTGRIEPVAMGGVHGKGFWLSGDNGITYTIKEQPKDVREADWYVSLFVDARGLDTTPRTLLSFPDGSTLSIAAPNALLLENASGEDRRIDLPVNWSDGWSHIGLNLRDRLRDVEVFHNGFELERVRFEDGLFALIPGELIVGTDPTSAHSGVRGWIDDLKVFAEPVSAELACNHAAGTLIGVEPGSPWYDVAERYPERAHAAIAADVERAGRETSSRYACLHDTTADLQVLHAIPDDAVSVREALLFPEGPVRYGAPRPDSSANAFCLSCHHVGGVAGLSVSALVEIPDLMMENDPRRQPSQAMRRVFGNIPAEWVVDRDGTAWPEAPMVAPADGALIEAWLKR